MSGNITDNETVTTDWLHYVRLSRGPKRTKCMYHPDTLTNVDIKQLRTPKSQLPFNICLVVRVHQGVLTCSVEQIDNGTPE